ncbi:hypothetical protein KSC_000410 [Ktedonobacter sp. SOSP1-52]|nr:hypothetical protein KSC_000410 [Ktedonobacter sp. SOSP1-52]
MGLIVTTGELLVVGQLRLHLIELLLAYDGGNVGHCHPLRGVSQRVSALAAMSHGDKRRLPMPRRGTAIATNENGSRVDRIG